MPHEDFGTLVYRLRVHGCVELDSYGFVLLKNAGEKKLSNKSVTDIPYIAESEKRGVGSTNYVLKKI